MKFKICEHFGDTIVCMWLSEVIKDICCEVVWLVIFLKLKLFVLDILWLYCSAL